MVAKLAFYPWWAVCATFLINHGYPVFNEFSSSKLASLHGKLFTLGLAVYHSFGTIPTAFPALLK